MQMQFKMGDSEVESGGDGDGLKVLAPSSRTTKVLWYFFVSPGPVATLPKTNT